MKVGILGSGQVGQGLAGGFGAQGHDVVIGTRTPAGKVAVGKAQWGTFEKAAKHGDVVVLCVNGKAAVEAVRLAGPQNLAGKLVLDTTNPLDFSPTGAHWPETLRPSILQLAQKTAPKAHFVKALNCTPGGQMVNPKFREGRGDQIICGNDAAAKKQAIQLLGELGWNALDIGDESMAPYIEGMALAVINYGAKSNDWGWGVKLVGRATATAK
ncbi:MAG: NADPH-dependent F420 reductase [Thermoplasmatota archaeon]